VNKLFLEFDKAWWPEDFKGVNLLWLETEDKNIHDQHWLKEENGVSKA